MEQIEVGDIVKIVNVGDNGKYFSIGDIGKVICVAKDDTIQIDFTYQSTTINKETWWAGIHDVEIISKAAK